MAGHPTIGTAFALASRRTRRSPAPRARCSAMASARCRWISPGRAVARLRLDDPVAAGVWPAGRRRSANSRSRPGRGADRHHRNGLPVQEVSCGVPFLIVPLASRAALDPGVDDGGRRRSARRVVGPDGVVEVFLFSTEPDADGATSTAGCSRRAWESRRTRRPEPRAARSAAYLVEQGLFAAGGRTNRQPAGREDGEAQLAPLASTRLPGRSRAAGGRAGGPGRRGHRRDARGREDVIGRAEGSLDPAG